MKAVFFDFCSEVAVLINIQAASYKGTSIHIKAAAKRGEASILKLAPL